MIPITIFVSALFLYVLLSERVAQTPITAPIIFTTVGMVTFPAWAHIARSGMTASIFLRVAEIGLVLLLFTDASRTDLKVLRTIRSIPSRLLSIGMILTILLGAIAARLVLPQLSFWEAGILGAILAPTDAGLGQVIVSSQRVPMRIREALSVEAGLNDGLSVPFLLFFMALAASKVEGPAASLLQFIGEQLGLGLIIGITVGMIGGWLLHTAEHRGWIAESFHQLGVVTLPLFCLLLSEMVDASMFIAAFVAGLTVQIPYREAGKHSFEFAEEWGQLFNLAVFLMFGVVAALDWRQFTQAGWIYAMLSLTLVRMVPVAISLFGAGLSKGTVLFIGWFGTRGLASIVLGMVYLEQELHLPGEPTIRTAVMITVLLSIFAHGLSTMPGIEIYATKMAALDFNSPERQTARDD